MSAICHLRDKNGSTKGTVIFTGTDVGVKVSVMIYSGALTPGNHGFHVHEKGGINLTCEEMGGHFNPDGTNHGGRYSFVRHVGDLGNIVVNNRGGCKQVFIDNVISLEGRNNIIGRSLVVHTNEDDLGMSDHELSKTTGNSGSRELCGTILSL